MIDLSTSYLGLSLKNPLVPSASPLSEHVDGIRRLEDAGAAAVVLHSLFEEQLTQESHRLDHYLDYGTESFAEAVSYFPDTGSYLVGPDQYLEKIQKAKAAVDIPIIPSLNGISSGGWTHYAKQMEAAGADALELNIYYIPTDPDLTGADVEERYLEIVREVRQCISIPLSVKLGRISAQWRIWPCVCGNPAPMGLVLFNRFYQPDFDLNALEVTPHLILSSSYEMRLPLRWVAMLYGRIDLDFAITSGVQTYEDVLKGLMAGANVMMMASELLRNGINRLSEVLDVLRTWMTEHEYESVRQMQGSMSQLRVTEPTAFERANYMKVLQSWRPDPTGELFL